MERQSLEEKLSIISSIPPTKGIFGFAAETVKNFENGGVLKKSRKTKLPTPDRLQRITTIMRGTVWMGDDYQSMVNKAREREGKESNFVAKETYCVPVSGNNLLFQHKKTNQLYFRIYLGYGATMTTELKYFDLYGNEISPEEYREIKEEYLKLDSDSSRQGLENEIKVKNYKVENILRLKRGEEWIDT